MRQVTKEKIEGAVAVLMLVGLLYGAVTFGWPAARGAYEARRLAGGVAAGANGRQFTVMDMLEQLAAAEVQRTIQEQKQAAEAAKAEAEKEPKP